MAKKKNQLKGIEGEVLGITVSTGNKGNPEKVSDAVQKTSEDKDVRGDQEVVAIS